LDRDGELVLEMSGRGLVAVDGWWAKTLVGLEAEAFFWLLLDRVVEVRL
jgi:hypothetical protein